MKIAAPSQISAFIDVALKPDEVTRVNCIDINQKFGSVFIHGFEGFLVIESSLSLDVVAVYTAGATGGQVTSIDVERVAERRLG